jgi:hypothetical protein
MTGRRSLGWAACLAFLAGLALPPVVLMLTPSRDPGAALGVALVTEVFALAGGLVAWRTGPGKVAVIGALLVGAGVLGCFLLLGWAMRGLI